MKSILMVFVLSVSLLACTSAQKKIHKANDQDPQYQYNMGLVYLNNGDVDRAILYFKKALKLNPEYDLAFNSMGLAYSMKGELEKSVEYFQKCIQINPVLTEAHNNLGAVYQEIGLLDKAEQQFKITISDKNYKSKELPYFNLARLYHLQEKTQEALNAIEMSLESNNRMVMTHNLKGVILEGLNKLDEAIDSYQTAQKIAPDDVNISFNLAVAYFKNNEVEKAKEIFERIRDKTSDLEMKNQIDQYLKVIKN
ncbi:tetratricopeptide repeat protein [Acidobacteriota bacterium]